MDQFSFNIRVYGLLISNGQVMLTTENYSGMEMTKFPGGGLEYGEGPADTLKRELIEELCLETYNFEHFYTTDFFQESAFHSNRQLISIYFLVKDFDPLQIACNPENGKDGLKSCRFEDLLSLDESQLTFPIDKKVAQMLREKYSEGKI